MTTGRLMLDDGELHYQRRGHGSPVVLLHGGGLGGVVWDRQVALLERDHTVIRYDARGHGASTPPEGPFSHYEDLELVLDGLRVDRATLVGSSMGARTSIDFALTHPDRVAGLVLVGPGISGMTHEDPFIVEHLARLRSSTDVDEVVECLQRMWVDGPYRSPDEVDPAVRKLCRELTVHAVSRRAFAVWPAELHAVGRVAELAARTLVVVGDLDSSDIHAVADLVHEGAPRAEKVVVEGAGHLVNLDRPEEFDRALLRFLSASR